MDGFQRVRHSRGTSHYRWSTNRDRTPDCYETKAKLRHGDKMKAFPYLVIRPVVKQYTTRVEIRESVLCHDSSSSAGRAMGECNY
jgi:hypothetical protein